MFSHFLFSFLEEFIDLTLLFVLESLSFLWLGEHLILYIFMAYFILLNLSMFSLGLFLCNFRLAWLSRFSELMFSQMFFRDIFFFSANKLATLTISLVFLVRESFLIRGNLLSSSEIILWFLDISTSLVLSETRYEFALFVFSFN